ncbi:GNAT family N-acetyltransferase [Pseudoclavibacter sp. VKM Ac-2888]|uniref:GNAT family N-acetyltransferase n=1 Tax=Pseudoclavibacter sp. VKM Ac-2888 TaxID=2783830 RepID=UPI00188CB6A3|nr:GNAT family N-acetyltransferase [Pseudoclavibacter sp. VKM Ac-2888]MBF4549324.1 GNAT family N-acetyltransferase [Pseudoclavibacter sp. VKM Ac-2888]
MTIRIRQALPGDINDVRYVGTIVWPSTYGPDKGASYVMAGLDKFWSFEAIASAIQAGNIDVAESEAGVIGMVHVENFGDDLVMWKLYVLPNQQRNGVGRHLVGIAKDRARVQGKRLLTEYDLSNGRVRDFYLREGFRDADAPWPGAGTVWLRWDAASKARND